MGKATAGEHFHVARHDTERNKQEPKKCCINNNIATYGATLQ